MPMHEFRRQIAEEFFETDLLKTLANQSTQVRISTLQFILGFVVLFMESDVALGATSKLNHEYKKNCSLTANTTKKAGTKVSYTEKHIIKVYFLMFIHLFELVGKSIMVCTGFSSYRITQWCLGKNTDKKSVSVTDYADKIRHDKIESLIFLVFRIGIAVLVAVLVTAISSCETFTIWYCLSDPWVSVLITFQSFLESARTGGRDATTIKVLFKQF